MPDFDWDIHKEKSNVEKHGYDFTFGAGVFAIPTDQKDGGIEMPRAARKNSKKLVGPFSAKELAGRRPSSRRLKLPRTDRQIEAAVSADADAAIATEDELMSAEVIRTGKEPVNLRLDADVVAALRATGKGWQTRVNAILRQWMANPHDPTPLHESVDAFHQHVTEAIRELQRVDRELRRSNLSVVKESSPARVVEKKSAKR